MIMKELQLIGATLMTARRIMTAVIAFVALAGATAARTVTSQARGQTSADQQGGGQQILRRSVTRGEGADQAPSEEENSVSEEGVDDEGRPTRVHPESPDLGADGSFQDGPPRRAAGYRVVSTE